LPEEWWRPIKVAAGTALADHDIEEFPYRIGDRAVVTVDEQQIALVVLLLGVPCQMDLANMFEREIREIGRRAVRRDGRGGSWSAHRAVSRRRPCNFRRGPREAFPVAVSQNCLKMLVLEAGAGKAGGGIRRKAEGFRRAVHWG
jgi:hypothetical protein